MAKNSTGTVVASNWTVTAMSGTSSPGTIVSATDGQGNPVGRYTAPSTVISPKTVTVMATSQANSSATGTATVLVTDNAGTQSGVIELGTTGGNSTDSVTTATTITCCSGTLGSLIQRGGVLFILSNNHVLDKSSFGTVGDSITQPGLVDNNCTPGRTVATLSEAAALKPNPCTGVCTGPAPSNVDAAIAQVAAGAVDPLGGILDLGNATSTSIGPAPPSSTTADPATVLSGNEGVAKSGRSTGLTCSTLSSVTTTVSVDYDSSCGGNKAFTATFTNQIIINGATFSASGDSGSLVVTSDTARPVGLLFAGNSTSTSANRIQDVLSTFTNGSGAPTFISNADHGVSCNAVAQPHSVVLATSNAASPQELERVTAAKEKFASQLYANPAVRDITVGSSADNPQEGAVVITVHGSTVIPAMLDSVRTRVVYENAPAPRASVADINRAAAIVQAHAPSLMKLPGIQGVGVGVSDDNTAQTALVIYVISGMPHPEIPAVIDGMRTKIIEGDRFRAFGWGHETRPSACSQKQKVRKNF